MLAAQNEYIKEASTTIYQLSQEEAIRQQCEAREDYYRRQRTYRPTTGRSQNRSKVEQRIERTTARQREKGRCLLLLRIRLFFILTEPNHLSLPKIIL